MQPNKVDFWPKEGKLKKGLIILVIVIVASVGFTLLEEKTNVKLSKKATFAIAIACIGIWLYKPTKNKEENNEAK